MFWIDIDEIDILSKSLKLLSRNKFNIFNFRDDDHFKFPKGDVRNKLTVKEKLNNYLTEQGVQTFPQQVFLLTHLRMFGHVFNPVSFYYCYKEDGNCMYVVAEISNTYGEMKLFFIDHKKDEKFEQHAEKYFYVSPFIDMDTEFVFRFQIPDEKLHVQINVNDKQGEKFFISTLTGSQKKLTDSRLLSYVFRFPFVTLKVIGGIHWEAFKLWLKKMPYHKKKDNKDMQRGITNI